MKFNFSDAVGRGLKYPALFLAVLAGLGMVAIVGIIVTSVLMRKFFNSPLYFSEEVVGLLMSVSLFLALPLVTLHGTHIRVTLLSAYIRKLNRGSYMIISRLASLVGLAFCCWLLIDALPWLEFAMKRDLRTETSRILLYPGMLALPLSVILMGMIFLARLFGWIEENDENDTSDSPENHSSQILER